MNMVLSKLSFSGHESFFCKQFWLKKGFDFSIKGKSYTDPDAVVELGVGKNMVGSIRFWLKAFGLNQDNDVPSTLGLKLFNDKGYDPYIEDIGTLWLLHYSLVKEGRASIYSIFFNDFRKGRYEFNKKQLHSFLKSNCEEISDSLYNENTINRDIEVFIRNYERPDLKQSEVEDNFSGLLNDLNLISKVDNEYYRIENTDRGDLPAEIILYTILDNEKYDSTISFKELLSGFNSPGSVFSLSETGLYNKLQALTEKFEEITYSENAGIRVLQFKSKPDKWQILNKYYGI